MPEKHSHGSCNIDHQELNSVPSGVRSNLLLSNSVLLVFSFGHYNSHPLPAYPPPRSPETWGLDQSVLQGCFESSSFNNAQPCAAHDCRACPTAALGSQRMGMLYGPRLHSLFFLSFIPQNLSGIMSATERKSLGANTWLLEIGWVILSLASLLAILIFLACYNGQLLFSWHRITLNTVISIFATLSRLTLVVAVSSALGQWRWNWFSGHSHPLTDFERLDGASRGSFGSFCLLWRTKSW